MENKNINIEYTEYNNIDELSSIYKHLISIAIESAKNAYAPYSNFKVGAAVLIDDNTIITGNNQENVAYPSGLCAERVALFYAKSINPDNTIKALAIAALENNELTALPVSPCGACRQVFAEIVDRQNSPFTLLLVGRNKILLINDASLMLPLKFMFKKHI